MFRKIINFLSLTDQQGNLSISNVAVIVCITKIAVAPTLDFPTIAALLLSLLNYGDKRRTNAKTTISASESTASTAMQKVAELESKLNGLIFKG